MDSSSLSADQRARLLGSKLAALVESHWGEAPLAAPVDHARFAGGASIVAGTAAGRSAWVLVDDRDAVGLGSVLAWARPLDLNEIFVLADQRAGDHLAGDLARHAGYFVSSPLVYQVEGRSVAVAAPATLAPGAAAPDWALAQVDTLLAADLDVVIEHGVVSGEVLGLEVARVVLSEAGDARIDVGVGRNDREAFAMLHGDLPAPEALARVVEAVRKERRPGAPSHPLNRLGSERWLRTHMLGNASRLGSWSLRAVAGPVARQSVNDRLPAVAIGADDLGQPVVLAFSVGIDLELVPQAADARALYQDEVSDARLILVMPDRDAHAVTRHLASSLKAPAEVLAIAGDWRS